MAANSMSSPHNDAAVKRQTVYVYGIRAWLTRLKLLAVYVVAVLLLLAASSSWQMYMDDQGMETLNPVLRSALLFGMWLIAIVTAWRRGNTKVSRIDYLPERDMLEVRTLNFLSRYVPMQQIRRVEYQFGAYDSRAALHPRVTISIREMLPLEIDTLCAQIDKELFEQLFPRPHTAPLVAR